ncbi:autotransporter assembly complex protein TamA [Hyphococcus sp.]|uniref:autotransporter assembly complex protein TamA n=1 Tax=Hyphococcus sp. TaxID=2038636 RepID=UPI0020818171|nr:MAG: outer membrane protein assembly factor [Marinicaulis sp.]
MNERKLCFPPQNDRRLWLLCGVAALVFAGPPLAGEAPALALQPAASSADAAAYSISIEGAPGDLGEKLGIISELAKGKRDYPTAAALRRAARRDVTAFDNAMQAAGYYDAKVEFDLTPADDNNAARVIFTITPGAEFHTSAYRIIYQDDAEGRPTTLDEAESKVKNKADGASLREVQEKFLSYLWNNGFPSAQIISRRTIADFDKGEAEAIFVFTSGPKARFGAPHISGVEKTDPGFIARMQTWEDGEEFERGKMTTYAERIRKTGLFSTVDVKPGLTDENGVTPILVQLEERKQRTIGAGVSFSTTEGPGGRVFFEHRNIFGHGENLRTELRGSEVEQSATVSMTRPMPRIGGEAFAAAAFQNETTDAFNARTFEISGGLSKKWMNDKLETRGALALETSSVRNDTEEERTYFVSTPLSVIWNSEDDLLDPRRGFRASWTVTPYAGSDYFTQSDMSARGRVHMGKDDLVTLAARAAVSSTFGSTFADLPLNKRYYAGGGGSVRGFGYQEAGPLDADNNPIGGRSRIEGAFEARLKVIKNLQFAAFIDAGSVSTKSLPDFTDDYFIGYGAGVRYLTPIGPIRADIAFPLEKRPTDNSFQLYIALGQPF